MPFNIQASSSVDRSVEAKLIEQGAFAENWEEKLGCSTSFHSWKLSFADIKLPRDPFFLVEMIYFLEGVLSLNKQFDLIFFSLSKKS